MPPSGSELRTGDFAWNLWESALDLKSGMLIHVTSTEAGDPFCIRGDIILFAGQYNGSGYFFLPSDLQKIELEHLDGQ